MLIPALATIEIPVKTVSEANSASSAHWRARHKRAKEQNETVLAHMLAHRRAWEHLRLPLTIVLVRYSVGTLDRGNDGAALKYVQDGVTDALGIALPKGEGPRPHNQRAPGFKKPRNQHYDDRDRLEWHYAQRKCQRGREHVEVRIYQPGCVARWMLSQMPTEPCALERFAVANAEALDALLPAIVLMEVA